jgi:hypothetical protein
MPFYPQYQYGINKNVSQVGNLTLIIDEDGNKFWYNSQDLFQYHRENGPAVEGTDGSKHWWINGLRHREDGPASEYSNGIKEWFINGKRIK